MQIHGLALGGSLENAMVFNDVELLNTEGYGLENKLVKHKLLDCMEIYSLAVILRNAIS